MPKGNHISEEIRQMIWIYFNLGKIGEECRNEIFFWSESCLHALATLFQVFDQVFVHVERMKYFNVDFIVNWVIQTNSFTKIQTMVVVILDRRQIH